MAPVTRSRLRSRWPTFEIPRSLGLPPVVCFRGTRLSQAEKWRPRHPTRGNIGPVAGRHDRAQADDAGLGRVGQQDGEDRLGSDDEEGVRPGSRRHLSGRGKEKRDGRQPSGHAGKDVRTSKGKRSMRWDRENQCQSEGFEPAVPIWTRSAHFHTGQRLTKSRTNRPDRRQHHDPTAPHPFLQNGLHSRGRP